MANEIVVRCLRNDEGIQGRERHQCSHPRVANSIRHVQIEEGKGGEGCQSFQALVTDMIK
jgi:hypothetical protein